MLVDWLVGFVVLLLLFSVFRLFCFLFLLVNKMYAVQKMEASWGKVGVTQYVCMFVCCFFKRKSGSRTASLTIDGTIFRLLHALNSTLLFSLFYCLSNHSDLLPTYLLHTSLTVIIHTFMYRSIFIYLIPFSTNCILFVSQFSFFSLFSPSVSFTILYFLYSSIFSFTVCV